MATSALLFAAYRLEQGASARAGGRCPRSSASRILGAPFALARPPRSEGERVLNLYIWSNYIAPETLAKFEERHGVRVNVDLFDSNEALLAKVQAGGRRLRRGLPVQLHGRDPARARACSQPLDRTRLPNFDNLDPRFLNRHDDPGNRYSIPYFWGTCGIGYRKSTVGAVDSWDALWDARIAGASSCSTTLGRRSGRPSS